MRQTEGERNTVTWMSTVAKARAFKLGKDERPQSLLTHCRRETLSPLAPTLEHHHRPATLQRIRTSNHNNGSRKASSHPPPMTSIRKDIAAADADDSKHIHNPPLTPRRRLQEENDADAPSPPNQEILGFRPGPWGGGEERVSMSPTRGRTAPRASPTS